MIVPTSRLLIFYAVAIPLLTVLPVLERAAATPAFATGLTLILVGLLDAALSSFCLRNIRIDLPAMVRMTRDRESSIELNITNSDMQARALRLGLILPREISSPRKTFSPSYRRALNTYVF